MTQLCVASAKSRWVSQDADTIDGRIFQNKYRYALSNYYLGLKKRE